MNTSIIPELEEQRRDALVAYYLGQMVTSSPSAAPIRITTPEDLYEYLLIDNQVSAQVETSRVAQAIASLQQYIHAIYNRMEPGYPYDFTQEQLNRWHDGMSEYSTWAGYQMIEDYPENYIDPTLRQHKSSQFQAFEMELAQSRITHDSVQTALKNYLSAFEVVSNLKVVSGYIDGTDFANADYYFIGRQTIEPFSYYWRKAAIFFGKAYTPDPLTGAPTAEEPPTELAPTAWSEWKKIDAALSANVSHARGVVIDGRLHLIWVEHGVPEYDDEGKKTGLFFYHIKMAFKQLNDSWSPATTLHTGTTQKEDLSLKKDGRFVLTATMDIRDQSDPHLAISFQWRDTENKNQEGEFFLQSYDKYFNPLMPLDESKMDSELNVIAQMMYGNDPARLQYPFTGLDTGSDDEPWTLSSVVWDETSAYNRIVTGGLNQSLELTATLHKNGSSAFLEIQGLCDEPRLEYDYLHFYLKTPPTYINKYYFKTYNPYTVEIINENGILFATTTFYTKSRTTGIEFITINHELNEVGKIYKDDFKIIGSTAPYLYVAKTSINVSLETLRKYSAEALQAGAGFRVDVFHIDDSAAAEISLANNLNSIREVWKPIRIEFELWHFTSKGSVYKDIWKGNLTLNGAAKTPICRYELTEADKISIDNSILTIAFGVERGHAHDLGWNHFKLIFAPKPRPAPTLLEHQGALFLDLNVVGVGFRYVRLNSLFAKEFSRKAQFSLESVLNWESQHTLEPPYPDAANVAQPLDFNSANARYFWEIFFHVPHLIAHRLHSEFDYIGAENWLHNIFNPQVRVQALNPPPQEEYRYWACRPLAEPGIASYELDNLGDPDAIAYSEPLHYRKNIFIFYVNNLIVRGDMLYRQLTRDTLNEAKLHYVRALSLLGALAHGRSISQWTPKTLEVAAQVDPEVFNTFENSILATRSVNLPHKVNGEPWLRLLNAPSFRLPVNSALLDIWGRVDLRLSNLRHNLTLDGKPLQLSLYEPAANPLDLLRAQLAGRSSAQRRLGSLAIIPPYRFRAMLPRVQNAVETLIRFGDQVRGYMEQRDRAHQEEMQQSHVLDLSGFTQALQVEAIAQSEKTVEMLQSSSNKIQDRVNYYTALIQEDVSTAEKKQITAHSAANSLNIAATAVMAAGHLTSLAPNIFGTSSGGGSYAGPAFAAASALQASAQGLLMNMEELTLNEQFRRRRVEWEFLLAQSKAEREEIELQIETQKIATTAAKISLAQAQKAQAQAQEYYTFLKNRATGAALYQWLLSQMSTLYFQAYDVVLSLCLSTEACWQYEIGDRDTHFIPSTAWADNYYGLTAGETLKLGLLRMESAFLNRHERRLELTKTISLRQLLGEHSNEYPQGRSWEQIITALKGDAQGELTFALKASTFDKDYPGHYLRQLINVSLSIPAVLGPYQNIRATLTQQSSDTLMAPDMKGVRYLYTLESEEDQIADNTNIMSNPRAYQQIGLSTGVDDRGMFMMDFGDERYYPFEGTGAISTWTLHFPRFQTEHQVTMFDSLTDIIVHVRYLAVDGGKAFQQEVEKLVDTVDPLPQTLNINRLN